MSYEIGYREFCEGTPKKAIKEELDTFVRCADWQEGASGLYGEIQFFTDGPLASYSDAVDFLDGKTRGEQYTQAAVRYREPKGCLTSPRLEELEAKAMKAMKQEERLRETCYFRTRNAKFVTCPGCGSKLSVEHLAHHMCNGTNFCPLCRTDLRPKSLQDAQRKADAEHEKACRLAHEERMRLAAKADADVFWLVRYEYHT